MATVIFTAHLREVGPPEPHFVDAKTIAEALSAACDSYPRLGGYLFDDQRRLRKHIAVFVNGTRQPNDQALTVTVGADTEIYILQALSGG